MLVYIIYISFALIVFALVFHKLTRKFCNPYKLIFVFGKKGSGKSTLLEKLAVRYKKRGWSVYSTEVDKHSSNYINPRNLYNYHFPANSCILIDEASLIWDNRDFKTMDKRIVEWFRYQRHHKCRVYLFSQSWDVDLKIRNLCDEFYLVRKYARVFVIGSRIIRKPVVVHPSAESPARIDDDMIVDPPFMAFFGGKIMAFIPYWAKRFDSHKIVDSVVQEK